MTIIQKLFKIAVRVRQYKERIKLSLPSACPVKGLLSRVTKFLVSRASATCSGLSDFTIQLGSDQCRLSGG